MSQVIGVAGEKIFPGDPVIIDENTKFIMRAEGRNAAWLDNKNIGQNVEYNIQKGSKS